MNWIDFKPLLPEILLLGFACTVLILDLYSKDRDKQSVYVFTQLGLATSLLFLSSQLGVTKQVLINGTYVLDDLAVVLKMSVLFLSGISLVYIRVFVRGRRILRGELYSLVLFASLGMMVMISASHLLTLYLGLELLSLTLYAMIAMERDNKKGTEAAVKYFVTGAIASGFILYGMSLVYGVTGQLQIGAIQEALNSGGELVWLARFALVFLVAGIAFKLGLVPFHMWLPDVYHGSPTAITAFLASTPKIAGFGFAIRLLLDGMGSLSAEWGQVLLVAGLLSITLGNLIAIAQTNLKRLLAYSGIAHMGYFVLGLYAGDFNGYAASMFYVMVYALMTLAGFGIIIFMSRLGYECETLDDIKGLGRKNPWYALMLTLVMLSMAGIPPLFGFWPKLEIFRALVMSGHWGIAVYAILFSVVGLYYYLRVIKVVYFDDPSQAFVFLPSRSIRFTITFNCVSLLFLGLIPDTIYRFCIMVFS